MHTESEGGICFSLPVIPKILNRGPLNSVRKSLIPWTKDRGPLRRRDERARGGPFYGGRSWLQSYVCARTASIISFATRGDRDTAAMAWKTLR